MWESFRFHIQPLKFLAVSKGKFPIPLCIICIFCGVRIIIKYRTITGLSGTRYVKQLAEGQGANCTNGHPLSLPKRPRIRTFDPNLGSLKEAFGVDDYFQHFKPSNRNWLLVGRDMLSKDTVAMGQHNTGDWLEERWHLLLAAGTKVASLVTHTGRQAAWGPSPCWDPQG